MFVLFSTTHLAHSRVGLPEGRWDCWDAPTVSVCGVAGHRRHSLKQPCAHRPWSSDRHDTKYYGSLCRHDTAVVTRAAV